MQFSVYDIMNKISIMHEIIRRIESDESIEDYEDDIHDLIQEYSDILKCAQVKI